MRSVLLFSCAVLSACASNQPGPAEEVLGEDMEAVVPPAHYDGVNTARMGFGTIALSDAVSIDFDELEDRAGNTTTLVDEGGHLWELSWKWGDVNEVYQDLKTRGFELYPGDEEGFVARVGTDGGDACLAVTGTDGVVLLHSTPVGGADECPTWVQIRSSLADVLEVDEESRPDLVAEVAWGTNVGTYNSVIAYSNGSTSYVGPYSTYGYKYQCVEYVNRYFVVAKGKSNMKGTGNAKDYCSGRPSGVTVYTNTNATKPATGDFLVSNGGTYGHIAIVRSVGSSSISVIHQNWSNTSSDNSKSLTMSLSGGKYTVSGFSSSYPVTCWGR
jgi:surface antigen